MTLDPTLQWLRQQAERARRYARQLVGDQAQERLQGFARQLDEKAAALAKSNATGDTMPDHADDLPTDSNDRESRIRERAYHLWEAAGRPEGRHQEFWEQAETQETAEDGGARPSE